MQPVEIISKIKAEGMKMGGDKEDIKKMHSIS